MTILELGTDGVGRFAHVGDSRAYLLRDGSLRQLTVDHTVAAEYVAAGKLTPEEAHNHPQRNMITRALGLTQNLLIDEFEEPLEVGDRFLPNSWPPPQSRKRPGGWWKQPTSPAGMTTSPPWSSTSRSRRGPPPLQPFHRSLSGSGL